MVNPEQFYPMVTRIAGRFAAVSRVEFDDLYQEGCMALLKALKRHDESKGYKASTIVFPAIYWACFELVHPVKRRRLAADGIQVNQQQLGNIQPSYDNDEFERIDDLDELSAVNFHRLSETERKVLYLYHQGHTFAEVGNELGFSKQHAHKLYQQSIQRLAA